mmetsp:Transcript_79839/g.178848  ORF Transcript_79839/g.178848 Transcript_79839/m.178848 type:complete len:92 (+) Transcript_79839:1-276(+)
MAGGSSRLSAALEVEALDGAADGHASGAPSPLAGLPGPNTRERFTGLAVTLGGEEGEDRTDRAGRLGALASAASPLLKPSTSATAASPRDP